MPTLPTDPLFAQRFWALVGEPDEAGHRWWQGGTFSDDGYPIFTWTGDDGRRWKFRANRVALALTTPAPFPGMLALHHPDCANPGCVAEDHLRWGTAADNIADRDTPQRRSLLRARATHRGQLTLPGLARRHPSGRSGWATSTSWVVETPTAEMASVATPRASRIRRHYVMSNHEHRVGRRIAD